ncbi:hypothetical protein BU24DRAFT_54888 [Aaosphaeria arxii CBS 175.79]|uniref:Uncharacterized protein n=1 Tax=Aaosphaeria arxii CBS 175.79 TaxID=1450172 RepID=A0A6A5XBJ0_9PLEO|nr:uncharacterized protein BU24DRAFT_54888 [Aaosphaeria arxii CBS 175.79]KAF2010269.1 hypothetical protein BU24DRAFT_54888 [Aaosphaeria arxii CBS 175.79]
MRSLWTPMLSNKELEDSFQTGLKEVDATVVTAFGSILEVHWRLEESTTLLTIFAPRNTSVVFQLSQFQRFLSGQTIYHFSFTI